MQLKIYTDGGSSGNPGPAAIAYVIYQDNQIIFKHGEKIGIATNNFAEYQAVIEALEKVKQIIQCSSSSIEQIAFFSDSALIVNQLNGLYKVKNSKIREFVMKVRILEQEIKIPIVYKNIPREENREADKLVKLNL